MVSLHLDLAQCMFCTNSCQFYKTLDAVFSKNFMSECVTLFMIPITAVIKCCKAVFRGGGHFLKCMLRQFNYC